MCLIRPFSDIFHHRSGVGTTVSRNSFTNPFSIALCKLPITNCLNFSFQLYFYLKQVVRSDENEHKKIYYYIMRNASTCVQNYCRFHDHHQEGVSQLWTLSGIKTKAGPYLNQAVFLNVIGERGIHGSHRNDENRGVDRKFSAKRFPRKETNP